MSRYAGLIPACLKLVCSQWRAIAVAHCAVRAQSNLASVVVDGIKDRYTVRASLANFSAGCIRFGDPCVRIYPTYTSFNMNSTTSVSVTRAIRKP